MIDPIEPEMKTVLNRIVGVLRSMLAPANFVLFAITRRDDKSRINYVSSLQQASMLAALREFLTKYEGEDMPKQIAYLLPVLVPPDIPPGRPMALVFELNDKREVAHLELHEWEGDKN